MMKNPEYKEYAEVFYDNLYRLKMYEHVSWKRIASGTGLSVAVIRNYRKSPYLPNVCIAKKVADFFEVSIEYLLTDHRK